jgi:hypothetical protein
MYRKYIAKPEPKDCIKEIKKNGENNVPDKKLEAMDFKIKRSIKSAGIKLRESRIMMFPSPSFKNGRCGSINSE